MSVGTSIDNSKFIERLKASPIGSEILEADRNAIIAERQSIAEQIAALHETSAANEAKEERDVKQAWEKVQTAERVLREARADYNSIYTRVESSRRTIRTRIEHLEKKLREGASHLIQEFTSWCIDEAAAARKQNFARHDRMFRPNHTVFTNTPSINQRCSALLDAMRAADEMKLAVDQFNIGARLSALKANLPAIEDVTLGGSKK